MGGGQECISATCAISVSSGGSGSRSGRSLVGSSCSIAAGVAALASIPAFLVPAATAPSKNVISARARHRRPLLAPSQWLRIHTVMSRMHLSTHNSWITMRGAPHVRERSVKNVNCRETIGAQGSGSGTKCGSFYKKRQKREL